MDIQLCLKAFVFGKVYFVPRCCVEGPDSLAKAHPVEICDADAESSGKLFSPLQQSLFSDRVNISRFVTSETADIIGSDIHVAVAVLINIFCLGKKLLIYV